MANYFTKASAPASKFSDCHFLGNGRLGASIYGEVGVEKIILNDDTLWSGYEQVIKREDYYQHLQHARKLALEKKYMEANAYMDEHMSGSWCQSYLPMASVSIIDGLGSNTRNGISKITYGTNHAPYNNFCNYERVLKIDDAISTVQFDKQGKHYLRESFVSHDYQVLAMKVSAINGTLSFAVALQSELRHESEASNNIVALTGNAPDNVEPQYTAVTPGVWYKKNSTNPTLGFATCATISQTDGTITCDETRVYVNDATYAVVLVAGGTSYMGYDAPRTKTADDVLVLQKEILAKACSTSYEEIKQAHLADYHQLYQRVKLELGEPITDELDTSKRFELYNRVVQDPSISAMQMQYARYLMISGSRRETIPLNLQGIWNELIQPAWSANFTANINVQMNYWLAETLNLSECHEPLLDYIYFLAQEGRATAEHFYHAPGWVANHNLDIWGHSVPVCETNNFAHFIFGGVWLCQHIWTHYEYTKDHAFLEKFYSVLKGAAEFILSQLVESEEGWFVTAPSTSPENRFMVPGETSYKEIVPNVSARNRTGGCKTVASMSIASSSDMTMTRELFANVMAAAHTLGLQDDFTNELSAAEKRLRPYKIGRFGQFMEWSEDFEECSPGMGHVSHMYSVYPAQVINAVDTPELFEAAKKSFERRYFHGAFRQGWPASWGVSLAARLGLSNAALDCCNTVGTNYGVGMLTASFHSQIDSILGLGAGIAEMLLQSHCDMVHILPACPDLWSEGSYEGFMARGGFSVTATWKACKLVSAQVTSLFGNPITLKAKGLAGVQVGDTFVPAVSDVVCFDTKIGTVYELTFQQ